MLQLNLLNIFNATFDSNAWSTWFEIPDYSLVSSSAKAVELVAIKNPKASCEILVERSCKLQIKNHAWSNLSFSLCE